MRCQAAPAPRRARSRGGPRARHELDERDPGQARSRRSTAQEASGRRRMTQKEITSLVTEVEGIMQALKDADPADKAEVYSRLGVTLTYHPNEKRVAAEARPASIMYVGACPRGVCTTKPMPPTTEFMLDGGI